ncbi:hypothetical protein BGX24_006314, partial [Mortierella sp. AD032]
QQLHLQQQHQAQQHQAQQLEAKDNHRLFHETQLQYLRAIADYAKEQQQQQQQQQRQQQYLQQQREAQQQAQQQQVEVQQNHRLFYETQLQHLRAVVVHLKDKLQLQ